MKKRPTFSFVDTESEAIDLVEQIKAAQSRYMNKHHEPHYTPWSSTDGKEHKFVVWYHI